MRVSERASQSPAPRGAAYVPPVAARAPGATHALESSPRQVAQRHSIQRTFGAAARPGVVQRTGFGAETTYGLEIEFVNRWLTPLPLGKGANRLALAAGEAYRQPAASPALTVTGDDGRGGTTVLEIESRIFTRDDLAQQRLHAEVEAMLGQAHRIIAHYRSRQGPLLAQERREAGRALGEPVQGDVLEQAAALVERLDAKARGHAELRPGYEAARDAAGEAIDQRQPDAVINPLVATLERHVGRMELALFGRAYPQRLIFDRCEAIDDDQQRGAALREALAAIVARRDEAPQATLQVTTLGRKGAEHGQALSETSAEVSALNLNQQGPGFAVAGALHGAAEAQTRELMQRLNPRRDASPGGVQMLEDFRVTLECAVKMVAFAEQDMLGASGTMKNLPYALPRRMITPPVAGYAAALGMDPDLYGRSVQALAARLAATGSADDESAVEVMVMLQRGQGQSADQDYADHEAAYRQKALASRGRFDPSFSLWTVEGGKPTLESDIIAAAGKADASQWTAHELRNFGWAMGMTIDELRPYLDLLRRKATER